MLRKIIFKKQGYLQLTLSTVGAALGFFVLLAGIQFYLDLTSILVDRKQMATSDFLVLHKKVSDLSMLKLKRNDFSPSEIEEIRQQPFIENAEPITPGLFEVIAALQGVGQGLEMKTAMYFEAIDDAFIDVENDKWHWQTGQEEIPIILPSILLDSYNFGMAPSQNLPPITEKTLTRFHYEIIIKGKNSIGKFKGIIVGFSDRINTILVPKSFLTWANDNFKYKEIENPAQVVIQVSDVTNPKLAQFLTDHGYETNQDKLKGSRIKSILNISLMVMLLLGGIILILAAVVLIQYSQIVILKVKENLKIILALGYHPKQILPSFLFLYAFICVFSALSALILVYLFKTQLTTYFEQYYFTTTQGLHIITLITAALTLFVFFIANVLSVYRLLKSLAKQL